MPDHRPPIRPLFLWIAIVAALDLGCTEVTPAGPMRDLGNAGFGVVFLLLLRRVFASGTMSNPLGADRDFSPAPVVKDLLIGVAFALVSIGWAAAYEAAVRLRLLPDTELPGYTVGLIPLFALLAGFVFFLGRGLLRMLFGCRGARV